MTPPIKDLKTRHYNKDMNMDNNVATLPKKGLKTRHYSKDMNMDNNVATLPKKGLKTRPYNIGMEKKGLKKYDCNICMDMEKKDLKKLTKGQLLKQGAGTPARRPPKPTRAPPLPPSNDFKFDDDIFQTEKGLKTRHYSKDMNMDNNVATLPKKGLKTRPYNIGMEKKGLKKYDCNICMDMEKKDLKKLTKGQLLKQGAGTPAKRPPKPTRAPPLPPSNDFNLTMTYSKPKTRVLESSK